MRGDASTNSAQSLKTRPAAARGGSDRPRFQGAAKTAVWTLATAAALALGGCEGPYYGDPGYGGYGALPPGKTALSWTLGGMTFTPERCQSERIDYMNVTLRSTTDGEQVGFVNVTCGLDRYSVAMAPSGPVRLYVDAVRLVGSRECVRYSGIASGNVGKEYPQTPTSVPLQTISNCR